MAATYTVKEVADILGYSTNSIYTFLKEKRIKGIRVGRGRFRIPQAELDRLLQTKTKSVPNAPLSLTRSELPLSAVTPLGVVEPSQHGLWSFVFPRAHNLRLEVPSLFDWFLGIGTIVLGFSMFLFSRYLEEFAIERFAIWLGPLKVTFIAAGIGLLYTDVVGKVRSVWHGLFHWVLVAAFAFLAVIMAAVADLDGVILFGVLVVAIIVNSLFGWGAIAGFSFYLSLLFLVGSAAAVIYPPFFQDPHMAAITFLPPPLAGWVGLATSLILAVVLWWGYRRKRQVFWGALVAVSVLLLGLSLMYAREISWGRAFFILVAALTGLFIPWWESLTFTRQRDRAIIFAAFGTFLFLLLVVVGIVRVLQTNIMEYSTQDLSTKATYGRLLVEGRLARAKTALESANQDPLLVEAVTSEKKEALASLSRMLFGTGSLFRRILIFDRTGEALAVYPYDRVIEGKNFGFRDYFQQAVTTKKTFVSNLFEAVATNPRPVIVVSLPILDEDEVVGVLAGSLDLDILGDQLQQTVSARLGQYVEVVDRTGRRLVHPWTSQIGTQIGSGDTLLAPKKGVVIDEAYGADGIRVRRAADLVGEAGWVIAVAQPVTQILRVTNTATFVILAVTIGAVLIAAVTLLLLGWKNVRLRPEDSS